jgi:hypothetical protein
MACSVPGAGGGGKRAYRGGSAQLHLQAASAAPRLPVAVHIMLRYEQVSNPWTKPSKFQDETFCNDLILESQDANIPFSSFV